MVATCGRRTALNVFFFLTPTNVAYAPSHTSWGHLVQDKNTDPRCCPHAIARLRVIPVSNFYLWVDFRYCLKWN